MEKKDYKKILKVNGFCNYNTFYRGVDHLLIAKGNYYTEDYSRVFFDKLKSIKSYTVWTGFIVTLSIFATFLLLLSAISLGLFLDNEVGGGIIFIIIATFFLALTINKWVKGPTQVVVIETVGSEQTMKISSKGKVKKIRAMFLEQFAKKEQKFTQDELYENLNEREEEFII
ncbi:hypothetical protein AAEX28_01290 [Lentisphaerota bacterium WC36G]|nr:hypothetical protein LJT99_04175 [Lentisphaerae bacterium WC36]